MNDPPWTYDSFCQRCKRHEICRDNKLWRMADYLWCDVPRTSATLNKACSVEMLNWIHWYFEIMQLRFDISWIITSVALHTAYWCRYPEHMQDMCDQSDSENHFSMNCAHDVHCSVATGRWHTEMRRSWWLSKPSRPGFAAHCGHPMFSHMQQLAI